MARQVYGQAGVVDPDAQAVLDLVKSLDRPPLQALGVADARKSPAGSRALFGLPPPAARTRDLIADLPGGPTAMRLYRPQAAPDDEPLPLALYFHGGGWMLGDLDFGHWFCAALVDRLNLAVLAIDYRLAPEHPFPAAVEDAVAALDWAVAEAQALAVRPDRMAVVGDSAGGNLAAVCAIHARDAGQAGLKAQVLVYPATDLTMASGSYRRNAEGYLLMADTMAWFIDAYLAGADARDWRASPIQAELKGVAPALVINGGFDVLCDEAEAYADKLEAAGVPVRRVHFAGQLHGFLLWAKVVGQSRLALDAIVEALRERLTG